MDYQKQADDFLEKTKTTLKIEFLKRGKHFEDDKKDRDIYEITISRGNRNFSFNFGYCIAHSGQYIMRSKDLKITLPENYGTKAEARKELSRVYGGYIGTYNNEYWKNKDFKRPTAYDILAVLTTYDPENLENFCAECGYDTDSKRAEKIYNACTLEYKNLLTLFNDEEMEMLSEIQ